MPSRASCGDAHYAPIAPTGKPRGGGAAGHFRLALPNRAARARTKTGETARAVVCVQGPTARGHAAGRGCRRFRGVRFDAPTRQKEPAGPERHDDTGQAAKRTHVPTWVHPPDSVSLSRPSGRGSTLPVHGTFWRQPRRWKRESGAAQTDFTDRRRHMRRARKLLAGDATVRSGGGTMGRRGRHANGRRRHRGG